MDIDLPSDNPVLPHHMNILHQFYDTSTTTTNKRSYSTLYSPQSTHHKHRCVQNHTVTQHVDQSQSYNNNNHKRHTIHHTIFDELKRINSHIHQHIQFSHTNNTLSTHRATYTQADLLTSPGNDSHHIDHSHITQQSYYSTPLKSIKHRSKQRHTLSSPIQFSTQHQARTVPHSPGDQHNRLHTHNGTELRKLIIQRNITSSSSMNEFNPIINNDSKWAQQNTKDNTVCNITSPHTNINVM